MEKKKRGRPRKEKEEQAELPVRKHGQFSVWRQITGEPPINEGLSLPSPLVKLIKSDNNFKKELWLFYLTYLAR